MYSWFNPALDAHEGGLGCAHQKLTHRWRAPTASQRSQKRAAPQAARRSEPLTPRRAKYAEVWLQALHSNAYSHRHQTLVMNRNLVGQLS